MNAAWRCGSRRLDDATHRVTRAAPNDPRAWVFRSILSRLQGNWPGAFSASDEALRIDPFRGFTLTQRAGLLIYSGRAAEALPLLHRAVELDPGQQANAWVWECFADLMLARDSEAIAPCEKAAAAWPAWVAYMLVTAAYANLGNVEKAAYWKGKLLEQNPRISIKRILDMQVTDKREALAQAEHWLSGLRKAGIPNQ